MVSSDNYNAVVLPASYAGDFETTFDGTGPFKLEKFTPKVGATFVRNEPIGGRRRCSPGPNSSSLPIYSRKFWHYRAVRST